MNEKACVYDGGVAVWRNALRHLPRMRRGVGTQPGDTVSVGPLVPVRSAIRALRRRRFDPAIDSSGGRVGAARVDVSVRPRDGSSRGATNGDERETIHANSDDRRRRRNAVAVRRLRRRGAGRDVLPAGPAVSVADPGVAAPGAVAPLPPRSRRSIRHSPAPPRPAPTPIMPRSHVGPIKPTFAVLDPGGLRLRRTPRRRSPGCGILPSTLRDEAT